MDLLKVLKRVGLTKLIMLAITQSNTNYYYLNWIPSEQGPLVQFCGSLQKINNQDLSEEQNYFNILEEIFSKVDNKEHICTFSLDSNNLLMSTCFVEELNEDMINWHFSQSIDSELNSIMDFYHYPMALQSKIILNIGVPKSIRQSFLVNMRLLKSRLNCLCFGIFSAEIGARKWFNADDNINYLIWKAGKKKQDELLFINEGEVDAYFCIQRKNVSVKILWCHGNQNSANSIIKDIISIQTGKQKKISFTSHVYLYTAEKNINEVKRIHQLKINNLTLLNPLSVLNIIDENDYNEYTALPFAETGIAFRGIDV